MSLLIIGNINTAFSSILADYNLLQTAMETPLSFSDIGVSYAVNVSFDIGSITYSIDVSEDINCVYSLRLFLENDINSLFALDVYNDLESVVYSLDVSLDKNVVYTIGFLSKDIESVYSLRDQIFSDYEITGSLLPYSSFYDILSISAIQVNSDIETPQSIRTFEYNDLYSEFNIYVFTQNDTQFFYELLTSTPINLDLKSIYSIFDPTSENIFSSAIAKIGDEEISFLSASISIDEDSFCWSLDMQLSNKNDWAICQPGLTLSVLIGSDEYLFIIDSTNKDSSFDSETYSLNARSPSSIYGDGSTPIHKTWGEVSSHDILDELIPTGIVKNIQNWVLKDGRLTSKGSTAIAVAKLLADADGCVMYSLIDGTLYIGSKYKIPPPLYSINNVDHIVSDLDDITNITQTKEIKPKYSQVEVSDEPDSSDAQLTISMLELDTKLFKAKLRVDVFPFVQSITLLSSRDGVTILGSDFPTISQIDEEVVEIINGYGSTSQLIKNIIGVTYEGISLGVLTFNGNKLVSEISGTSLIRITYTTEYHVVTVKHSKAELVQMYNWEN